MVASSNYTASAAIITDPISAIDTPATSYKKAASSGSGYTFLENGKGLAPPVIITKMGQAPQKAHGALTRQDSAAGVGVCRVGSFFLGPKPVIKLVVSTQRKRAAYQDFRPPLSLAIKVATLPVAHAGTIEQITPQTWSEQRVSKGIPVAASANAPSGLVEADGPCT